LTPGFGIRDGKKFGSRINLRDPDSVASSASGSGIRDKHPGLARLVQTKEILLHFYPETFERICVPDTRQSKPNFKQTAVLHLQYSKKTNVYIIKLRIV
jgi:hypothetical protein